LMAHGQDAAGFYGRLSSAQEQLQRTRTSYVFVSMWPRQWVVNFFVLFGIAVAALLRVRGKDWTLLGLALVGLLSVPVSWLLLEQMKWALMPQIQPLRALLFVALAMQFLAAIAAFKASRWYESFGWFALAYLLVVQPVVTDPWKWKPVLVVVGLAALSCVGRVRGLPVLAAFFAIPIVGGVVNYPKLHTPELAQLSTWAHGSTPVDAVFLFPDAGRGLAPGIFRSEAQRAVYVDWKGGGQVNYLREFGEEWWFRWQQTMAPKFTPAALPKYDGLGIQYVVLQPKNRMTQPAEFENAAYLVYRSRR